MSERLPDATYLRALAKELKPEDAARLNEIADGLEWRPIAEAPKDGRILVYFPASRGRSGMMAPRFDVIWSLPDDCFRQTTHWRPLPAPPVGTGEV